MEHNVNNGNIPERMYPVTAVCKDCNQEFVISVKEQMFAQEDKGYVLPKRCRDCRDNRKSKVRHIVCMECGDVFQFTASEQEFYAKNDFKDPKRCKKCRMNKGTKSE